MNAYDVAIIGSGMGGATLAAVLARQGLKVIVFEAGTHPRFTVGESMILETSEVMRALAELYDVPELAYFSSENYFGVIGTSHGVKRHFSFLLHRPGEHQNVQESLQAVIPRLPYGHELHIHRQDSDYFLTSVAIGYGAEVLQGTRVLDLSFDASGVDIESDKGVFRAQYLVDAGGMRSVLAEKMKWRHQELQTHTRTLFTHMINVPCFNEVAHSRQAYGHPFRHSEGTLHHVFKGGWLWVIPFNNHAAATNPLCSVGLQLDPRVYPMRPDLSPEEEFRDFIAQFPDICKQFEQARTIRAWIRTDRLQYGAHHVVGDRFALLGHAAGFIDPLYSKGLYVTHMAVMVAADLILKAHHTGDYSAEAFAPLETLTLEHIRMHDRLVANSLKAFSHADLWSVYSVLWLLGAYQEYLKLTTTRLHALNRADYLAQLAGLRLAGGGFEPFFTLQQQVDALIEGVDVDSAADVAAIGAEIRELYADYPWMPRAFRDLLNGKTYLPKNKLRAPLLSRRSGFQGDGTYRSHFFGEQTLINLVPRALFEQKRYSAGALRKTSRVTAVRY